MPTETTTAQDRVLQVVREAQDASIQAVRRWSEGVASVVPRLPELFYPDRPEQAFGFAAKLWAAQWEFGTKLLEAAAGPLAETASRTADQSSNSAANAASSARTTAGAKA